nr:ATP-binding protein [Streptomyces sp. SID13726]
MRGDRRASTPAALDVRVLAVPEVVADLRRSVRRYLGSACGEVQLCVTELVANVVRHVGEGTPIQVRVACVACDRVRVEVTDPDARALPVLLRAAVDEEAGRGLALLDAVALRWGVEQRAQDKTVWCELPWPESESESESRSGAEGLTRPVSPAYRRATT